MSELDFGAVDVEDMLTALGIRNAREIANNEVQFSCPFPGHSHGDEEPSACMNKATTAWFCFGCGKKGNAISFLAELENISPLHAARLLRERYESGWTNPIGGSMTMELEDRITRASEPPVEDKLTFIDDAAYELFHVDWASRDAPGLAARYLHDRGFTMETLEAFRFGYDAISDRITFPIKDDEGRLIGFKGRTFVNDGRPKYSAIGDTPYASARYGFPTPETSRVVFGMDMCRRDKMFEHGMIRAILCEGEWNAVMLHQYGLNGLALSKASLSDEQASILRRCCSEIVVYFDDDEAGRRGTDEIIDKLQMFMRIRVIEEHESDACDTHEYEVEQLIDKAISSVSRSVV